MGSYGPWIKRLASNEEREYSFLHPAWDSPNDWKEQARRLFAEHVTAPRFETRPQAETVSRRLHDGLSVEEVTWQLPYGPQTSAYFLKPAHAPGKLPGILALHDHGGNKYYGKEKIAEVRPETASGIGAYRSLYYGGRAWANEVARRGYGVLVHDVFPFGSRKILASDLPGFVVERMMRHPEHIRELTPFDAVPGQPCRDYDVSLSERDAEIEKYNAFAAQHEHIAAKVLFSAGLSWPGLTLAEDSFALDYLASRPDIDADRIGCCGLSGGGLRTVYLGATDDRIRCSVSAGFMTTWADFALHTAYTHTWMIYIPRLPAFMDFPDILAMRIPLPTLVLANLDDQLFTVSEVRKAEAVLASSFEKAGAADKFKMVYYQGPHRFDTAMQEEAFAWFDRWLL